MRKKRGRGRHALYGKQILTGGSIILITTDAYMYLLKKIHPTISLLSTHLKWSCRATLKSKASPRSSNPNPTNACLPEEDRRKGGVERGEDAYMLSQWSVFSIF